MALKKILICCANGVATSTFVSMKCKKKVQELGIDAEIKTCTNLEVKSKAASYKPDLVISNVGANIGVSEGIPVVYGINLLSGQGADKTWEEIEEILRRN